AVVGVGSIEVGELLQGQGGSPDQEVGDGDPVLGGELPLEVHPGGVGGVQQRLGALVGVGDPPVGLAYAAGNGAAQPAPRFGLRRGRGRGGRAGRGRGRLPRRRDPVACRRGGLRVRGGRRLGEGVLAQGLARQALGLGSGGLAQVVGGI